MASYLRQRNQPNLTSSSPWTRASNYQQNLANRNIGIIIFRVKSNRLKDQLPHASSCLAHIAAIRPGQIVRIEG